MWTSHRDVENTTDQLQIPGRTQCDRSRWPDFEILVCLLTGARNCFYRTRLQIDATDEVVFGVGNVEAVAAEGEALRAIESCFVEGAVNGADLTGADGFRERAIEFGNNDSVVI